MSYDFAALALGSPSDEEAEEKKELKDMGSPDDEEILDMAIDAACNGCGDSKMRREAFKRAVCMILEAYAK